MKYIILVFTVFFFSCQQKTNSYRKTIEIDIKPDKELINKKYEPVPGKDSIFLRANDLVDKIIEFQALTPERLQWSEHKLKDNPPRLYLFQQIKALLKILFKNQDLSIEQFINGDFIQKNELNTFDSLNKNIIENYDYKESDHYERAVKNFNRFKSNSDIKKIFAFHFKFILELENLSNFNTGMIGSGRLTNHYAYSMIRDVTNSIDQEKINNIRNEINYIIDKDQRTFSMLELVENYGYPDLDLEDVNLDWY